MKMRRNERKNTEIGGKWAKLRMMGLVDLKVPSQA
jgi:hypothetical protein